MKILVACERSGRIRDAFLERGHDAWSCDLEPTDRPGPHIQGDALELLGGDWDMLIAHPVCRYLSNSGVRWLKTQPGRWEKMEAGARFFKAFLDCKIPRKAIENPIIHKYAVNIIGRRQDQVTQPHWFGEPQNKAICWWLENLPPLKKTNDVRHLMEGKPKKETDRVHYASPGPERERLRSETLPGVAKAIAAQWG